MLLFVLLFNSVLNALDYYMLFCLKFKRVINFQGFIYC
jgi:hypothetical protein